MTARSIYWVGDTLVLEQRWAVGETPISDLVRYTLADEGWTLVADEHMSAGPEGHHNVWVYGDDSPALRLLARVGVSATIP